MQVSLPQLALISQTYKTASNLILLSPTLSVNLSGKFSTSTTNYFMGAQALFLLSYMVYFCFFIHRPKQNQKSFGLFLKIFHGIKSSISPRQLQLLPAPSQHFSQAITSRPHTISHQQSQATVTSLLTSHVPQMPQAPQAPQKARNACVPGF